MNRSVRALFVPVIACLLSVGVAVPAHALEYKEITRGDSRGDVEVIRKSAKNKKIDINKGVIQRRAETTSGVTPLRFTTYTRDLAYTKTLRQNYAIGVRTNEGYFFLSYSNYGKRRGFLSERLVNGTLQPYDCGFTFLPIYGSNAAEFNVPDADKCFAGDRITQTAFYTWQTNDFRPKFPRAAGDWAKDVLVAEYKLRY